VPQGKISHNIYKVGILVTLWLVILCVGPMLNSVHAEEAAPPPQTENTDADETANEAPTAEEQNPAQETGTSPPAESVDPAESADSPSAGDTSPQGEETAVTDIPESEAATTPLESLDLAESDSYFFVNGDKYSFSASESTTPIQDALNAVSSGLNPDDRMIYVEGDIHTEDISISGLSDLTLQGSDHQQFSTLTGAVYIHNALNITLRDLLFTENIHISDSANVTLTGTENDDEITIELAGTVENLAVAGATGDDAITIHQGAESSSVHISGGDGTDSLTIKDNEDLLLSGEQVNSDTESVTFDSSIENLHVDAGAGDLDVDEDVSVADEITLDGDNIRVSGVIAADAIYVHSTDTSYISGMLVASGPSGGTVHVLGRRVALLDEAQVNVSGNTGGGIALIGGDYQGAGSVRNAAQTYIGPDVVIAADALLDGNGGRVIVWADETTQFYGTIRAQGGPVGGDGGFIETSGLELLEVVGSSVSAQAPNGNAGTWLLDPYNVEIKDVTNSSGGSFSGTNPKVFTPDSDSAVVDVEDITGPFSNGTSVTIKTGNTGNQSGNITVSDEIGKSASGDVILRLEAANDILVNANITASAGQMSVELIAGARVTVNATITTNGGDVTIEGTDVDIGSTGLVDAGNGYVNFHPSTVDAVIGIGNGATGSFVLDTDELTTRLEAGDYVAIGRSDGVGSVDIHTLNINLESYVFIVRGGDVTFNGQLTNWRHIEIFSNGRILDGNGNNAIDVQIDGGAPWTLVLSSKNGVGTNGTTINELETQVPWLVGGVSTFGGFYVHNSGGLIISHYTYGQSYVEGIITNGGEIRITADSPLRVSRAIRENGGGDINLTAGNNSAQLGDDLTIEADVVSECPSGQTCQGKLTGNAGDNIEERSGRTAAPAGVDFNAGLDGNADNGGGTTRIGGTVEATNPNASVNVNAANGITNTGTIIIHGGVVSLNALSGTVAQNGTIILNGGILNINQKPPAVGAPPPDGVVNLIDADSGSNIPAAIAAAATAALQGPVANVVLTVVNGQQVSLLEAATLGNTLTLQLPEGNGATFNTGIDALVSMTSGAEVVLPSELPTGFNLLSSLFIGEEINTPGITIGEVLVSFAAPDGTTPESMVVLQWTEDQGWIEIPLEDGGADTITALAESGGTFVLAETEAVTASDFTGTQQALSGVAEDTITIELPQGGQINVSGAAGELIEILPLNAETLPGDIPPGGVLLSAVSMAVNNAGANVSILPNGEAIEIIFDIPAGSSSENFSILYWLEAQNGGRGGWISLPMEITPEGRASIQTFFGGSFAFVSQ
jgi:hypothetical protein